MENRYDKLFAKLKLSEKKAFIPYTLLGYPNVELSFQAMERMIKGGAAALELGLAFSDPLADGPVIQQASAETIESGFKTKTAFELISRVRKLNEAIPITLMCYYNSVLAHGAKRFCKNAADAGVDGLLIVDLPPDELLTDLPSNDEENNLLIQAKNNGLQLIFIISPLTTEERLNLIAKQAGGFLYAVSRLGTTGVEERYDSQLSELIRKASEKIKLPVAVGFGVSSPEQAKKMYSINASAVITGSKIIEWINSIRMEKSTLDELQAYVQSMVEAGNSPSLASKA